MARLLSLIVCAVVAGASWSVGRAFVSSLPSTCRRQCATTKTTQMFALGRGGAQTVAVPDEATSTDVRRAAAPAGRPAAPAGRRKIIKTVSELVAAAKEVSTTKAVVKKASTSKKASTGGRLSQVGIFSPIVEAAKAVLGEEELASFRGEAIKAHTAVITAFSASLSPQADGAYRYFGEPTIRSMFKVADADGNGSVDLRELRNVVKTLGFKWLDDDSKISKIMDKMDKDGNEMIDLEEFMATAPVVLRQNLVKLAKKNGNELGFLV